MDSRTDPEGRRGNVCEGRYGEICTGKELRNGDGPGRGVDAFLLHRHLHLSPLVLRVLVVLVRVAVHRVRRVTRGGEPSYNTPDEEDTYRYDPVTPGPGEGTFRGEGIQSEVDDRPGPPSEPPFPPFLYCGSSLSFRVVPVGLSRTDFSLALFGAFSFPLCGAFSLVLCGPSVAFSTSPKSST